MDKGDFVTTTMKDFIYYPVKRTLMILPQRESCNALTAKETLILADEIAAKSDSENYTTPQEYLKKVLKENPNLEPQFEKGLPNDNVIRQEKKDLQKTVYFVDYCIPEAVKNAMQIKTGLSEYQYAINQTGNLIIEEHLVWRVNPDASAD